MNAIEWLENNVNGFSHLNDQERAAPMNFALLWSFFEGDSLGARASDNAIDVWFRELAARRKLRFDVLSPYLDYFKRRYYQNDEFTHRFYDLLLRQNDKPELVKDVLRGSNADETDSAIALFIIIYRLRNNFLHGEKWAYHLRNQLENFTSANESIMSAIEMSRA